MNAEQEEERMCLRTNEEEEQEQEQERNMDDDDDKLVSNEVHLRQLSSTPSSALQQRRLNNNVTHSAPPELTQRIPAGTQARQDTEDEAEQGVILRRAVDKGAITLAQIDDLKLESDEDDVDDVDSGPGLSNPAAQTTNDEQITATTKPTTATSTTTTTTTAAEQDPNASTTACTPTLALTAPDMSKIPRLPGDGAQMDDSGDLAYSLRASTASILSNLRKKQQAMLGVGISIEATGAGCAAGDDAKAEGRPAAGGRARNMGKQTPRRVQSVRIVEAKSGYGPKRRTESCSIFANSNFDYELESGQSIASIAGPQRPLTNETYSAFKSGNVVKGILCPSLTNSFKQSSLERSYLTYTHRQRQKSLIIVNVVDFVLKIVMALIWMLQPKEFRQEAELNNASNQTSTATAITWSVCCGMANLAICFLGYWRCFANNYLHWAAVCTWVLFNIQEP